MHALAHVGVDGPVNVIDARFGVAAALAFVSGTVDVIGWLSLDHLYTTHMIPLLLLVSLVVLDLVWPVGGPRGTAAWRREQRRRSGE